MPRCTCCGLAWCGRVVSVALEFRLLVLALALLCRARTMFLNVVCVLLVPIATSSVFFLYFFSLGLFFGHCGFWPNFSQKPGQSVFFSHPNEIGRAPPSMCVYFLSRVFTPKHNIRCASKSNHYWRVYKNRLMQSTRCVFCSLARNDLQLHLHARQFSLSINNFGVQIEQRL